jgi:hypothetical protein
MDSAEATMPRKRNVKVPGGTRDRIANTLRDETARCGHALRMCELRDRLPEDLARRGVDMCHALNKLVQQGVVVVVSGRRSMRQYRHRDQPAPAAPNQDIALAVYWVLCDLVATHGRPMTTREVSTACRAKGVRRTAAGYHPYLVSLSRSSHVRFEGAPAAPMVTRFPKHTLAGKLTYLWAPVDAVFPDTSWCDSPTPPLHNANERLRQAVAAVERETGRPVRRRDISWWWRANRLSDPVASGFDMIELSRRLQLLLGNFRTRTPTRKTPPVATPWMLIRYRTPFTGVGSTAAWFHTPGLNEEGLPVALLGCALEDACAFYRIGDEVESLRQLEVHAGGMGSQAEVSLLTHLAHTRRALLARVLRQTIGPDSTHDETVIASCAHALERRDAWHVRLRETAELRQKDGELAAGVHMFALELNGLRNALAEVRELLGVTPSEGQRGAVNTQVARDIKAIGDTGSAVASEIYPLALSAAEQTGVPAINRTRNVLSAVRRMPGGGAMAVGPRFERRAAYENVQLDRVDAVVACVEAVGASRTSAIVHPARALLGHVLRDADLLIELLAAEEDKGSRRNLVVALSLLGRLVHPEALVRDVDKWEDADVAAMIVATTLAVPGDALSALESLREHLPTSHSEIFDEAITRCGAGNLLSLVG